MNAENWYCYKCESRHKLNLPSGLVPPPSCPKCETHLIPLLRHVCIHCEIVYGDGNNKPIKGVCKECFQIAILEQRRNWRKQFVVQEKAAGRVPVWRF